MFSRPRENSTCHLFPEATKLSPSTLRRLADHLARLQASVGPTLPIWKPGQLRRAVENILGISSVKFITSLAGIPRLYLLQSRRPVPGGSPGTSGRSTRFANQGPVDLRFAGENAVRATESSEGAAWAVPDHRNGHRGRDRPANQERVEEPPRPHAVTNSVGTKVTEAMSPVRDELLAIGRQIGATGGEIASGTGKVFSAPARRRRR
jgi:hypothetical protein